jgi:hypothetical protein
MGKIRPTQLHFVYSKIVDESFFYYLNHIDELFRQHLELDFQNKTSLVTKFQTLIQQMYEKLENQSLTYSVRIEKLLIQKELLINKIKVP